MLPAPALPGIAVKLPVSIEPLQSGPAGRALAPAASRAARQTRRAAAASLGIGSREPTAAARGRGRRDSADAGATPSAGGAAGRVRRRGDRARHRARVPRRRSCARRGRPRSPTSIPDGSVRPDTVAVFRAVGAARASARRADAHRLALWGELPGIPDCALGPMLRHELEHARRYERSGPRFFEADDLLRAALRAAGGNGYAALPSELEANAASAAYAARTLSRGRARRARGPARSAAGCSPPAAPPGDVVGATLAALAARSDWAPAARAGAAPRATSPRVRAACAAWASRPRRAPAAVRRRRRSRWPERRRRALLYSACVLEQGIYLGDNLELLPCAPRRGRSRSSTSTRRSTPGRSQRRLTLSTEADPAGDRTGFGGRALPHASGSRAASYPDRYDDYLAFLEPRLREARRLLARRRHALLPPRLPRESHYCKVLSTSSSAATAS